MNHNKSSRTDAKGSALITVLVILFMMAVLTASMLQYSVSERRGNERNRLILRAKNMVENISLYSAEQLIPKLNRMGSAPVGVFPWTGSSANRIYLPPSSILDSNFTSSSVGMEMRCGIESNTPYALVNDVNSPNNGLQVSTAKVPIISKATATHKALGTYTAYAEQDMMLSLTPLFQFGIFYNMDLELFPGQDMTIMGPVHTNGRLTARGEQGGTAVVTFTDRVTAAQGLYADGQMKATYIKRPGSTAAGAGGTGAVYYTSVANVKTDLKSSGGVWRDHKYGNATETTSTQTQFKTFATTTYGGNVRTNVHGVSKLELPGIGSYNETNLTTTTEDDRNNGRQIIEPRNPYKWNGTTWAIDNDDAATKELKLSRKAGLYIIVNPDDTIRTGKLPDGSDMPMFPRSYRAWLNIVNSDSSHTLREVVLPGQPTYGYNDGGTPGTAAADLVDDFMYNNYLPNRYTAGTATGVNQVLRIPHQGYGTGRNYRLSAAVALSATSIPVDSGTGTIIVGDTISIGGYSYLVTGALSGGVVTIASPGIRGVALASGAAVTVAQGTGKGYQLNGAHAINATALTVDTGSGTVLPGNIVYINGRGYLVTAATAGSPVTSITIAAPGIVAAATDNTPVTVVAQSGLTGSAASYLANGGAGAATTSLTVDTGTGTIIPGNVITMTIAGNTYQYVVSCGLNGNTICIPSPGFTVTVPDNTAITVSAPQLGTGTGYFINGALAIGATSINVDTGTGTILPGNVIAIGSRKYMVTTATAGSPVTNIRIAAPGLIDAVADNEVVYVDPYPYTGYANAGGTCDEFPLETSTTPYPAEAYFFDLRRANGNVGYNSNIAGGSARGTTNYVPRAIAKIDFDMARFKMMFSRSMSDALTCSTYDVGVPTATNWANSIFNAAGVVNAALNLGQDADNVAPFTYNVFPAGATPAEKNRLDSFRLYYTPAFLTPGTPDLIPADPRTLAVPAADLGAAWYDGIAIYIHSVDAERRAQTIAVGENDRIDSGVRLINGRGPAASMTTATKTGFTFITNDAAYIVGHFNADGSVNATSTATGNGGYSARYPDSAAEKLTSVMADGITLLSQPVFTSGTAPYSQTNGWNDALSAFRVTNATWVNTWRSSAPSGTNNYEGLGTSATAIRPGALPNSSTPGTGGAAWQTKLPTVDTEFSCALLMGLIPSNHTAGGLSDRPPISAANAQYSGGAHNFPRLLEDWHNDMGSGTSSGLYIRGSMVALFESRVAMEPWNIRCYQAPERYWGLHEGFRTANHDVPLEPLVLGADRLGFRELSAAEYASRKAYLESLTVIP